MGPPLFCINIHKKQSNIHKLFLKQHKIYRLDAYHKNVRISMKYRKVSLFCQEGCANIYTHIEKTLFWSITDEKMT